MYRRPRNRVARDFAERFITRALVRRVMIEYECLSGLVNRPRCWLLGHEGRSAGATSAAITAGRGCAPEIQDTPDSVTRLLVAAGLALAAA